MHGHDEDEVRCPYCDRSDMKTTALLGEWLCNGCGLRTTKSISRKQKASATLNADLQAGRVKLPQNEWSREYLGEWKDDRPDAIAYGHRSGKHAVMRQKIADRTAAGETVAYVSPRGNAIVSPTEMFCARCRAPLTGDLDIAIAGHAERCFIVGDWVRWNHPRMADNWVEGELARVDSASADIVVVNEGPGRHRSVGGREIFGRHDGTNLRHIDRPGQAVKRPSDVRFHATDCGYFYGVDSECTCDERNEPPTAPPHPDDDHVEGIPRSCLLRHFEEDQRNDWPPSLSVAQRQTASEQWTQQLRLKQQEARERERLQVVVEQDAGDFEW
jgi:hypothetical protein